MILLKITDIKVFMNKLLIETAFDQFLLSEATISMASTYIIDGHINKDFYSSDELNVLKEEALSEGRVFSEKMQRFSQIKPFCLSIIKGRKTPANFKFTFCLADENIEKFLKTADSSFTISDIGNLTLNIKYDGSGLTATTAVSLNTFSLDKSINASWDNMIRKFFISNNISFEEM